MASVHATHGINTTRSAYCSRPDPFDFIWTWEKQRNRTRAIAGGVCACIIHGSVVAFAMLVPLQDYSSRRDLFTSDNTTFEHYNIELDKTLTDKPEAVEPPEPQAPEPAPQPQPTPKAAAKERPIDKPVDQPAQQPPAAAQAGSIVSAPEQPEDSVDLTEFVTGSGDRYVGGVTASAGTATTPTYNPSASAAGVAGAAATASSPPKPPPAPKKSLQRSATIASGTDWSSCPFPPQADMDQVDYAQVTLKVTVNPDGTAQSVRILSDPGYGFGRAAARCAKSKRYLPALNDQGKPVSDTTPPIRVTFTR